MKLFFNKKQENGFTIIEALVSIAIILLVVIGPLSMTVNSINRVMENKNRIIASYLAEETIENFKNYRDNYLLACSVLTLDYNLFTGELNTMYCGPDNTYPVVDQDFYDTTPPNTNPRDIAWKMFLKSVMEDYSVSSRENIHLDNASFNFNKSIFNSLANIASCDKLYLSKESGYSCSGGIGSIKTVFDRSINLTKMSDDTLKVEVNVDYTSPSSFLSTTKTVHVVGYVYKR